ncbi:unnamed protein product [Phyllotreta striolata]|uniref:Cytochrome P450 monooxygenase n=1 Tax=Phyllotreta striolata TaxID=444603 RepID=A0A9N9U1C6_PHYSR|nr:unnamed protein product [Phyllotreta striolata]
MLYIFLLAIAIPLYLLNRYRRNKRYEEFWKHIMAIPGPQGSPILGTNNTLHTPESLFIRDRKRAVEYYPIFKLWSLDAAGVFVMSPDDIELVLNNSKHINKSLFYNFLHSWLGTGLLTSGGSKWHSRRKILTPAFHFNILQQFVELLNKETQILVDNLSKSCSQPYVDVVKPITEFTLYSIGETSFGVSLRDHPDCPSYKQAVYDFGHSFIYKGVRPWLWLPLIYKLSPTYRKDRQIVKTLHAFSTSVINERKERFAESSDGSYAERKRLALLDLMLKAKQNGADIDDEGIREEVDTFIFEGHDTTSVSICYTLMVLANEPVIQEEIYQEITSIIGSSDEPTYNDFNDMKYMERCIKESLRLYPSVPLIGRVVGENLMTKSGYTIPKGCNVNISFYDMHRRPEIWEDPEKFDPDRFLPDNVAKRHPFAYLPFSAGSRNCIGQRFAILEIKAVLCGILRNFKLEPVDTPADMKYKVDLVLRPAGEIRVKFVPRLVNI